ncbi:MAG: hypothetical protein HFE68_03690 [Erysipelotrichaceae bacterium]|nr:hypothetical protein [Erysipelotrichaceae bacterium]MCI9312448.1 hypothetical protein [Erysipelotrichaceae bacterium]
MNELELLILKKLMLSYNKSYHSKIGKNSARRVILNLDKAFDSEIYDRMDYDSVCKMNDAVYSLHERKLITYDVDEFNDAHITKVYMCLNEVEQIASLTGLKDNKQELLAIYELLLDKKEEVNSEWEQRFLEDVMDSIIEKNRLLYLPKDVALIEGILKVLQVIAKEEGFYIRVLSTKLFSNSKYIEKKLLKYLIKILKDYYPDIHLMMEKDKMSDNEFLRFIGVFTYEEVFEFTGNCTAYYNHKLLDFSLYDQGMFLGSNIAAQLSYFNLDDIRVITLIENKMNYVQYCKNEKRTDELVIFSGGYYSAQKKEFYNAIKRSMTEHQIIRLWDDIDLGGFQMFNKLSMIFENLTPMRMDIETYMNHVVFAREMSDSYFTMLERLADKEGYEVFQDVIKLILKNKKVLEQESYYIE